MSLDDVTRVLETKPLTDVVVGGFVDREAGAARFHPVLESVYLRFGADYVRCKAQDQDYGVKVDVVAAISRDFPMDDGDEFCVASLFTLLLGDAFSSRPVASFRAFPPTRPSADGEAFAACEFLFEDAETLLVEPMVPYGLRLSNPRSGSAFAHDAERASAVTWTHAGREDKPA
jgi:hypothetical protein